MVFNRGHKYNARRDEKFQLQRGVYKNGIRGTCHIIIYIYIYLLIKSKTKCIQIYFIYVKICNKYIPVDLAC